MIVDGHRSRSSPSAARLPALCASFTFLLSVLLATGCDNSATSGASTTGEPTLAGLQRELFTPSCALSSCHGASRPPNGLSLTSSQARASLINVPGTVPGSLRVAPGRPRDDSLLYRVLIGPVGSVRQMPQGAILPNAQVDRVGRWIESGAPD